MPVRKAHAVWEGNLKDGQGRLSTESGTVIREYSYRSRFTEGKGTNPEELIGAAHAGCFSMALANALDNSGFRPKSINTRADVHLTEKNNEFQIDWIEIHTEADVEHIDEETFRDIANLAKNNCPVSKALSSVQISLNAKLLRV